MASRAVAESVVDEIGSHLDGLLIRAGAGDREAFAALYDALAPVVLGILTRDLADAAHSERVLEEVFVEVWRRAPYRRGVARSARTWILGIALRHASGLQAAA